MITINNMLRNDKYARIRHFLFLCFNYFGGNPKLVRGQNNQINFNESFVKKSRITITGSNNSIKLGRGSILYNTDIVITGNDNNIIIGDYCHIKGGPLWIEDNHCKILIGDRTTIEQAHLAATENNSTITIGKECLFAYNIEVRTGDSHSIIDLETKKRINPAKNVQINDHVWIGSNVSILKGVTIANSAIIATGAIVTKDVPAHCIIGGNPAKLLKENIDWKRERI